MRAYVSELLGTTFFVSAVLAATLGGSDLAPLAIGAAMLALVCTCAPMSGAQFNPAVSLAAVVRGILPTAELVPYLAAQLLGGLLAYLLMVATYGDQLDAFPGSLDLGGLVVAAFLLELVLSFVLVWVYLGTIGRPVRHGVATDGGELAAGGLALGGVVAAGTVVAGPVSGAALNPVVSFAFGMAGIIDWKWVPVYVLAQLLGAVLAAVVTLATATASSDTSG